MGVQLLRAVLLTVLAGLVTACSGGGSSSQKPPPTILKGQFIDSAVSGMTFFTSPSGLTGTTDANGTYSYKSGDTVEFFIGGISIGSAPATPIVTPLSIVSSYTNGTIDVTNTTVLNIARFLQSIDNDGDLSNGIQIPQAILSAAVSTSLDFTSATFDTDATTVLADLASSAGIASITGTLVDSTTALGHLSDSISICGYTGTYSGTWQQTSPDSTDNGTWTFSVSTAGTISGSGNSSVNANSPFHLSGSISPNGSTQVSGGTTTDGASFTGTTNSDGTISGTWTNQTYGTSGTFTGTRSAGTSITCVSSSQPAAPPSVANYGSLPLQAMM